jgi:transposase-like protein
VLTVGKDAAGVEELLVSGRLGCPGCGGRLRGWGHARRRVIRETGEGRCWLRPRRARCAGCGGTHVLLPVSVLARRADAAAVIGAAVAGAAAGLGHRQVAERAGRAAATVRGWLRRFRSRAEVLRSAFTGVLCALDPDPLLPSPAGSPAGDAVAAIVAAAAAVVRRWGCGALALSPWELAAAVTGGRLLAPGGVVEVINTSCPW